MQQLNNLTDAADQYMTITLEDASVLQLEIIYRPGIQRWTANINHPLLVMNGYNLALGPNILRQWRNTIPFGIAVTSLNGLDPMNQEDFADGNCQISILDSGEVATVEREILAPIPLVNA